ncbi:hypothetical protein FRB99_005038, partial [Tulasnella sp. 403]
HFDDAAAELEGFARRLWGAVPAGIGNAGSTDGVDWESYRTGITNGTDPGHPEYWGAARDRDQRLVEMAPIGFALASIPEKIWDPLSDQAKSNLEAWLLPINDLICANNNWHFFRVLVNLGLARVGAKYSLKALNDSLDRFEAWYLGDGWYSDGPTQQRDYYITFAIHYYSLIYAKLVTSPAFSNSPLFDPVRTETYRERAAVMINDFLHWFDPGSGACIPFGRSLTYRFACVSFIGAAVFAGVESVDAGTLKGVFLRHMRWWLQRPEIFNNDGTLSIGWAYPNLNMAEAYNSPGSPYWALKAFLPLALPPTHDFWTFPEKPMPRLPSPHPLPHAHAILIHTSRQPTHTYALTSGQHANFVMRHSAEKYGKLAYSATFGFSVPVGAFGLEQAAPDSTLALSDDADVKSGNGNHWRVRRVPIDAKILRADTASGPLDIIAASWDAWPDVHVRTWLVPVTNAPKSLPGDWHIRIHRVTTARDLCASDAAFSVHSQSVGGSNRRLEGWNAEYDEGVELRQAEPTDDTSALVRSYVGTVGIKWLPHALPRRGGPLAPTARIIQCSPNTSIMFPHTLLPTIVYKLSGRADPYWLVSGIFAVVGHEKSDWREAWNEGVETPLPEWLDSVLDQ